MKQSTKLALIITAQICGAIISILLVLVSPISIVAAMGFGWFIGQNHARYQWALKDEEKKC